MTLPENAIDTITALHLIDQLQVVLERLTVSDQTGTYTLGHLYGHSLHGLRQTVGNAREVIASPEQREVERTLIPKVLQHASLYARVRPMIEVCAQNVEHLVWRTNYYDEFVVGRPLTLAEAKRLYSVDNAAKVGPPPVQRAHRP